MDKTTSVTRVAALTACMALVGCDFHEPRNEIARFATVMREISTADDLNTAFEKTRSALRLKPIDPMEFVALEAEWSSRDKFRSATLMGSYALGSKPGTPDYAKRFSLQFDWSWNSPVSLTESDVQTYLGHPYGFDTNGNSYWLGNGGLLWVRTVGSTISYVGYYSPAYVKDPLDFVAASDRSVLPDLQLVDDYLLRESLFQYPESQDHSGLYLQMSCFTNMTTSSQHISKCVDRYAYPFPKKRLLGVGVTIMTGDHSPVNRKDFVDFLGRLSVPTVKELVDAAFAAPPRPTDSGAHKTTEFYAAYGNIAVSRSLQDSKFARSETVTVWKRIELPDYWRRAVRADLP